ncbi:hypothetical protein ANN_06909 [Periplaneta americana]|uniref:Uncharacterized protein n=1 Tax=Periplaneta americana TaxID=6978 RepID=A0ABQ8THF1_PERAM|nr:hypothetical protein ANN_06909 [Periplaneta americana]
MWNTRGRRKQFVSRWVNQWRTNGSVVNVKYEGPQKTVRTQMGESVENKWFSCQCETRGAAENSSYPDG